MIITYSPIPIFDTGDIYLTVVCELFLIIMIVHFVALLFYYLLTIFSLVTKIKVRTILTIVEICSIVVGVWCEE
jgi:hypothetical protein